MRPFTLSFICSLVIFTIPTTAILAVASGKCAGVCGNVTTTQASDIVCTDSDYANTPTGQAFENCINCEMNSSAVDPYTGDTDLKWLLYNLRFAMSACLWDYPNNTIVQDTPCITSRACGPFQPNIQFNNLSTTVNTYDYCGNFSTYQEANCAGCLKAGIRFLPRQLLCSAEYRLPVPNWIPHPSCWIYLLRRSCNYRKSYAIELCEVYTTRCSFIRRKGRHRH